MLTNIFRGIVIGIANILPGISGGTLAVSMGIYDSLIHCVTHIIKEWKKSIQILLPIGMGVVLAVISLSFVMEILFEKYPLPMKGLFIGLILAGIEPMLQKIKKYHVTVGQVVLGMLSCILIMALGVCNSKSNDVILHGGLMSFVLLFLVGVLAAATMIIPGISGSMILMLLGYYNPILRELNLFIRALFKGEWNIVWRSFAVLFPFGVGVLLGAFLIAKIIEFVFERYESYAYWAILGLLIASPFVIIVDEKQLCKQPEMVIIAIALFFIGLWIAHFFQEKNELRGRETNG